jgi:alanine racemase
VGAVVKADGYGMGAEASAERLIAEGCSDFFVATAEEGLRLRQGLGSEPQIYVFEGPDPLTAGDMAAAELIPVLNFDAQRDCWQPYVSLPVAVHVDTGMSRLGFPMTVSAGDLVGFDVKLLLTHLACADDRISARNSLQAARFKAVAERFPGVRTSVGNSAGWLTGGSLQGELGRVGIGLYGGNPFVAGASPVQPVASLQGRVLQIKELAAGETVGYGATLTTSRATRIAVVALGYADGLLRSLSGRGQLALRGVRCPILGRISMDMAVIDVTALPTVALGDWAECFGTEISVDEVAEVAGTIPFELFTGVGPRVLRCYEPLSGTSLS